MFISPSTLLKFLKSAHTLLLAWLLLLSWFDLSALSSDPASSSLAAYPEQMAQVKEENSAYHPLLKYFQPASGQWTFATTDLKVAGAQPLMLQRILLSPHIAESYHKKPKWDLFYLHGQLARPGNGWTFLPELLVQAKVEQDKKICYVTDSSGVTLAFCMDASTGKFSLDMDPYGMHNGLESPSSIYIIAIARFILIKPQSIWFLRPQRVCSVFINFLKPFFLSFAKTPRAV